MTSHIRRKFLINVVLLLVVLLNKATSSSKKKDDVQNVATANRPKWWQVATTSPSCALEKFARKNCTSCMMREEARMARIVKIKEEILEKLGFSHAPNLTGRLPVIGPHLHRAFSKWSDSNLDEVQADGITFDNYPHTEESTEAQTERIYVFATKTPASFDIRETVSFNFSDKILNHKVEQATLHFYLKGWKNDLRHAVTWLKFKVSFINSRYQETMTEVAYKTYDNNPYRINGHWIEMDVTKIVDNWFYNPEDKFVLQVSAIYNDENLVIQPNKGVNGKHTMFLEILTSRRPPKVKRHISKRECDEKDNETRCCQYPLMIDFESFGWDWVIAPKRYRANYCAGECPFRHMQRYLHTHILQQANVVAKSGPCCYPTDMSEILMVYFNENKEVLVAKVPGMVVTRCGCA